MKGILTAALLTMPLSLFAQGAETTGGTTGTTTPATTPTTMTTPATTMVTCVGKKGTALTAVQKKALETAGVKATAYKTMKAEDVATADQCKGMYTIENGTATKVMHKKMHGKTK